MPELVAITTDEVWRLVDVAPTTLNYWVGRGLCGPSLRESKGKRFVRYWSVQDVVTARAVKELREAGCSLQKVEEVQGILEERWDTTIGAAVLFWDGHDVLKIEDEGEVVSVLRHTGQQLTSEVIHMMTFPLRRWIEEIVSVAHEVDLEALANARATREARQAKHAAHKSRLEFKDAFRATQ